MEPAPAESRGFRASFPVHVDSGSARPIGQQNYALITRDYLNLNARVDYHFAMVDAVCGMNPRENHIRFRFKGGGTTAVQRERRAQFISEVLQANDFFVDQRGDLVTATILETQQSETEDRLVMLGRLLGFSRQLDATMRDDTVQARWRGRFMDGDCALIVRSRRLLGPDKIATPRRSHKIIRTLSSYTHRCPSDALSRRRAPPFRRGRNAWRAVPPP